VTDPVVSTIIPAYRAARTIQRAVDSVLTQSRPSNEIIVVDDGSPEDLAASLRGYGDRLRLIRKPNGGAASARNLGIGQSRGELLAFLDADDYWEPGKLEQQLAILRRYPHLTLIASRYFLQDPGQPRTPPQPAATDRLLDRVITGAGVEVFALATTIWTSTVVVRRSALGYRPFEEGLTTAEDRDLWIRVVGAGPVYIGSEPLATQVLEAGSLSRSNLDHDCTNMLCVVRRYRDLLGRRGVRQWEAAVYQEWAAGHLGQGRPAAALGPAWRRVLRQPLSLRGWWVFFKSATWAWSNRWTGKALSNQERDLVEASGG
jgi:glycosyltransferase involved in cell wall biosynthesis